MSKFAIGKYKNILVSIGLFLILDASVLMLNFYISFQIAEDATSINLAGRQRMLSQRMTKSLLDLDYSYDSEDRRTNILKELKLSRNLFDETFTAFDYGGDATGAGGNKVTLNKADDTKSRQAVDTAKNVWLNYREKIDDVLNNITTNDVALQSAITFGQRNNLNLLKLMNDLTVSLEQVAASKAQRLRLIQTAGIGMALINFFFILFHFVGQLRKGDEVLEEARKETTEILLTVNEGLFLIHEDFTIGSQRSEKLYEILSVDSYDDVNFESLLKDIVSYKDLEASQGFLRLLFNSKIKEKLIGDLNPLEKIQVNISDGLGGFNTKYLSFDFKRVYNEKIIVNVLATVNDITENVLLEKQLKEAKESNEQQIEMLTSILHANPSLLKSFLDNAYTCFSTVNNLLKQPAKKQVHFQDKINAIFVEIHNFKGESSALELTEFSAMAHDFEEDLSVMRNSTDIKGQDFLSLTVRLDKMISYAQSITGLVEKLSKFGGFTTSARDDLSERRDSWEHLNKLVNELSIKYQKQAMLVSSGLNDLEVPSALKETVNSLCIQFIRNAMVHGIETPEEREASQKSPKGRIDIRLSSTPSGMLEMVFRDDGAGFNFDKLREKALSLGKATTEEIETWDNKRLLSLIFSPGFSTADEVNDDAGRGVGMDVVMQKIKQVKGKITISHKESQYTRFTVSFPMLAMNQVA
jgi:HPt (histidine-containing phosphotransfer) domain-containing protein